MDHREDKAEGHIFDDGEGTIEEATSLIQGSEEWDKDCGEYGVDGNKMYWVILTGRINIKIPSCLER